MPATIENGIEIRKSRIPNAGLGLFATQNFKKSRLITEYQGKLISRAEAVNTENPSHICCLVAQHSYIDGLRIPRKGAGGGSFANDAMDSKKNNAKYTKRWREKMGRYVLYLQATKDIRNGEEIYVSYDKTYWIRAEEDGSTEEEKDSQNKIKNGIVDLTNED
jgi:SET domain-containing protein